MKVNLKVVKYVAYITTLTVLASSCTVLVIAWNSIEDLRLIGGLTNQPLHGILYAHFGIAMIGWCISVTGWTLVLFNKYLILLGYTGLDVILLVAHTILLCVGHTSFPLEEERKIYVTKLQDAFFDHYITSKSLQDNFNSMEKRFKCCGFNNYTDYENMSLPIPGTCCGFSVAFHNCSSQEKPINSVGCKSHVFDTVQMKLSTSSIFSIIQCVTEITPIIPVIMFSILQYRRAHTTANPVATVASVQSGPIGRT